MLAILPYERARHLKMDANTVTTAYVKPDLSGLTDAELDLLERIALKLGAATPGTAGPALEAPVDTRRAGTPPRAKTDRHRDARLRKTPKGAV